MINSHSHKHRGALRLTITARYFIIVINKFLQIHSLLMCFYLCFYSDFTQAAVPLTFHRGRPRPSNEILFPRLAILSDPLLFSLTWSWHWGTCRWETPAFTGELELDPGHRIHAHHWWHRSRESTVKSAGEFTGRSLNIDANTLALLANSSKHGPSDASG